MKKLIALLLALVMVLSMVACGAKAEQEPEQDAEETPEDPAQDSAPAEDVVPEQPEDPAPELGTLPLVTEETTITIGLPQDADTEDYDTNKYTLWIEEQTGINLEFVFFSGDTTEMVTQLNLMVAGGDELPDIIWGFKGMTDPLMYELGEDGYFVDMKDYFSEYGYWFWEAVNNCPEGVGDKIFQYGTDPNNGAFYGFPRYSQTSGDSCNTLVQINTQWLEAVGAEVPTNVDELYEVLKKFATEDPNGNGIIDEMPLIGYETGYRTDIVQFIINAFVYCCDTNVFNATDGEVWVPYTTDEYRQAMIYLNKLYAEGLLTPLFYTMTENAELKALATPTDGVALCGVIGSHPSLHWETDSEVLYQYAALAPLEGATELGGYAPFLGDTYEYNSFITCDAEDPVLCFKLLDFMTSQESFLWMRYGEKGVDWEYCEEGLFSSNGFPATVNLINADAYSTQNNQTWHSVRSTIMPLNMYTSPWVDDGSWTSARSMLSSGSFQAYSNGERPDETIEKLIYTGDELEVVNNIMNPLKDYIAEARAMFISGVMDPSDDAQWNTYLSNLEAQGMNDWLAAAQSAYTRMTAE